MEAVKINSKVVASHSCCRFPPCPPTMLQRNIQMSILFVWTIYAASLCIPLLEVVPGSAAFCPCILLGRGPIPLCVNILLWQHFICSELSCAACQPIVRADCAAMVYSKLLTVRSQSGHSQVTVRSTVRSQSGHVFCVYTVISNKKLSIYYY